MPSGATKKMPAPWSTVYASGARRHLGVRHAEAGGDSGDGGGIPCGRMKARVEVADVVGEQRWLVVLRVDADQQHARLLSGRQVGECRACLRQRRERRRTDVGAVREAEEHQCPPAREECRIERLAVLVHKGDRGGARAAVRTRSRDPAPRTIDPASRERQSRRRQTLQSRRRRSAEGVQTCGATGNRDLEGARLSHIDHARHDHPGLCASPAA